MFDKVWDWIKTHPLIVALIVGALVILYMLTGSGSSAGAAASSTGPTSSEVNAAAGVQIAQVQAQAQGSQLQAGLQAQNESDAANLSLATIQAGVAHYQVEQSANVQTVGINAQANVQEAGLQTQQIIAQANDATQVQIAGLSASTDQARIAAVTAISNAPYNVEIAQIQGLGPTGLADVINHAEGTKNSFINIGGITAGRNTPPSSGGGIAAAFGSAIAAVI